MTSDILTAGKNPPLGRAKEIVKTQGGFAYIAEGLTVFEAEPKEVKGEE